MEGGWIMIEIEIDTKEFKRKMLKAIALECRKFLLSTLVAVKPKINEAIKNAIIKCPEVQSILNRGELFVELGMTNPDIKINAMIDYFTDNVHIEVDTPIVEKEHIRGGFRLKYISTDYSGVLTIPEAVQYVENIKGEEHILEWLDWLLLRGDSQIIDDWIVIHKKTPASRTGLGIMARKNGGGWGIPEEFSGTPFDNFITRAVNNMHDELERVFMEAVNV